jgi:hypothetical protein
MNWQDMSGGAEKMVKGCDLPVKESRNFREEA